MWRWRRRKQNRSDRLSKPPDLPTKTGSSSKETGSSSPKGQIFRQFTIAEIRSATQDFNQSLLIGRGGFGSVYKGTIIKDGTRLTVAIKRWNSTSSQGVREFEMEVDLLPMLRHPNIVYLIGFCNDGTELILVYEYMSNGSLKDHLHKHRTPLSWSQRLKICINVASALEYLHDWSCGREILYINVKSAGILLDDQWAAKIVDFGISTTIYLDDYLTRVKKPEYMATGRLSKKPDVYSFGVVLLEVLCRRPPFDRNFEVEERELVTWVLDCMKRGKLGKIIDPELKGQVSYKFLNDYARIVKCCLRERQEHRVTIAEVIFGLGCILTLHERTDNSISEMDITTSDWRLQKYFFSSGYFRKDLKSSVTSHLREGDHGDQTESLYELMRLEYMQQADILMRMRDFLHLLWFYPVKKDAEVDFGSLVDKCFLLNEYIRNSRDSSMDSMEENYLMNIQILVQDIQKVLNGAVFDMVAYLPEDNSSESIGFENGVPFASFWSGVPEVHASAIASATQRAISCIKDLKVKKLGISGSGADKVAERLKEMSELKSAFDVVLCVHVEHYSITELLKDIKEEMLLWKKRSLKTENKITDLDQFLNCLLFLDCSDDFMDLHDPEIVYVLSEQFGTVHIVMTSGSQNAYCPMDMEIRVEDHLLPWILFFTNADLASVGKYSGIQYKARHLMEICDGNLLAIILLARALRGVVKISAWDLSIHEFASQHEPSSTSELGDVMVRVMRFIWSRMERLSQRCIMQFASRYTGTMLDKVSLINSWIRDELVKTEEEGENVFEDLIRSFLIERVGGNSVRMRNQIQVIILTHFAPQAYGLYRKEDCSESYRLPTIEEWDAREIHLSNNKISKLPDDPDCPILVSLFLNGNRYLMHIPITFFNNMPNLQALDLSGTSIKCLPSSISKLTTLQKFFIRDCDLLMELPPEIGTLESLKVFDSEGTQLICLPEEFGLLTKLERLKLSLCNFPDEHKQNNPSMQISLAIVLSNLIRLKELVVSVDSYGKWWEDEVKLIINILPKFQRLESLRLYFPTTELVGIFIETHSWRRVPIYQHLSNFGFVVGHLKERLISRVPDDLYKTFVKMPKCVTYTNGEVEGDTQVIASMLTNANALFLDRHWSVRSLSAFGLKEMERLKFCLLAECNEMLEIFNGSHFDDHSTRSPILGSLEHLSIHYMKSLTCILNRPIDSPCLPNLKTLTIHTCSELRAIFTEGLLDSLACLEYLVVEDCKRIKSLVSLESDHVTSSPFLPSLKKMSLLDLPELVSISSGIRIAPRLESLVVYDCPNLEELSYIEDSVEIEGVEIEGVEIKGEGEWWDALKWCEPEWPTGQPDYLDFIPLGTDDDDITDELTDAVNLLPYLGMGESTKEAQTVEIITGPGPTDKGKGKV